MARDTMHDPMVQALALSVGEGLVKDGGPIWEAHEVRVLAAAAFMSGYQMNETIRDREAAS